MPRGKASTVVSDPAVPKSKRKPNHRQSTFTDASSKTTDSDITKAGDVFDDLKQHGIADAADKDTKHGIEGIEAVVKPVGPSLTRRLAYDIILAKIEQGNKCDWLQLSERYNGKREDSMRETNGKNGKVKGKKGKKVDDEIKDGFGITGTELHEIYHNTILPALIDGQDLFRLSPSINGEPVPNLSIASAKKSKTQKRSIDDLSEDDAKPLAAGTTNTKKPKAKSAVANTKNKNARSEMSGTGVLKEARTSRKAKSVAGARTKDSIEKFVQGYLDEDDGMNEELVTCPRNGKDANANSDKTTVPVKVDSQNHNTESFDHFGDGEDQENQEIGRTESWIQAEAGRLMEREFGGISEDSFENNNGRDKMGNVSEEYKRGDEDEEVDELDSDT